MKGKIIFELTNIGTKSEFELPFLVLEDGKKVKIGFQGDNPFEQPTLHLYDQKEVIVDGEFNENKKWRRLFLRHSAHMFVFDYPFICYW